MNKSFQNEYKQARQIRARPRLYPRKRRNPNTLRLDGRGTISASIPREASLNMIIEPWMPLFPARTVRRLRYSSNCTLTATLGAMATYVLRANDLFDPDFTSTGHQPMGFDQMMLFYNHFCVIRARLIATFKCNSATNPSCALRVDANSTAITAVDRILEFGGVVTDTLEKNGVLGSNKTLQISLDVAKLQGVSIAAITADPTLRGDAATSPTEVSYFHLSLWDVAAGTGVCNIDFILEQEAVFMEPRDLTQS